MRIKRVMSSSLNYVLVLFGFVLILGAGVYAYGTSNPSVFGHSADEIDGVCRSDGVNCPSVPGVPEEDFRFEVDAQYHNMFFDTKSYFDQPVTLSSSSCENVNSMTLEDANGACNDICQTLSQDYYSGDSRYSFESGYVLLNFNNLEERCVFEGGEYIVNCRCFKPEIRTNILSFEEIVSPGESPEFARGEPVSHNLVLHEVA